MILDDFGGHGSIHLRLRAQFASRLVSKEYLCVCLGACEAAGEIDSPLLTSEVEGASYSEVSELGKAAVTRYRLRRSFRIEGQELSLLLVKPLTGRTHQIRAHLASIGHPLLGDSTYGSRSKLCERLFLHCQSIRLLDVEGSCFTQEAELPHDLAQVLQRLEPFAVPKGRGSSLLE